MNLYSLVASNYFKKKYKKIVQSQELKKALQKTLVQLENNPFYTGLKTHKVISLATNSVEFSSRVTGDIRVIWNFSDGQLNIIDLLDIGGHDGKNGVYK